MDDFIQKLETLRQALPDPFNVSAEIESFYTNHTAQELIAGGKKTIAKILIYLNNGPDSPLISPAVLLLAYFNPELFYKDLLKGLTKYRDDSIVSFDEGLWRIKKEEKKIAKDLLRLFHSKGNPYILLLLQRPVVFFYKKDLKEILETRKMPAGLFALYCYKYALRKSDGVYLQKFINTERDQEIKNIINEYILEAGK